MKVFNHLPQVRREMENRAAPITFQPLLREGIWVAIGHFSSAIGVLVGIRLLTEYVPPQVFGTVSLLIGIISLGSGIFCMPLLQAALRFYSELAMRSELPVLRRTIRDSLRWSMGFLIGILLLGGAAYSILYGVSYLPFLLLSALLPLEIKRTLETNFLTAARRQCQFSIWLAAEAWVRPALAILAVIMLGATSESVLLGYFAGTGVVLFIFMRTVKREGLAAGKRIQSSNSKLYQEIHHYALPLMPLAILNSIISISDRYIIGGIIGLEQVGIYVAMYGLISRAFMLAQGLFEVTFRPYYFNAVSNNASDEKRIFNVYFSLTLLTSTLAVLMVALFSKSIVTLFFGPKYYSGLNLLSWIALGHGALIMSYAYYTRLYAYKLTKIILLIRGLSTILCLIVETLLIYTLGLMGAALACPIYFGFELLLLVAHAKFFLYSQKVQ